MLSVLDDVKQQGKVLCISTETDVTSRDLAFGIQGCSRVMSLLLHRLGQTFPQTAFYVYWVIKIIHLEVIGFVHWWFFCGYFRSCEKLVGIV